ncbi:MAG TPA: hypothetical protein VHE35_10320 [Kofleriaceae bacterium]|nr:hypothetical protein [Kofleriaceae bacterium]
MPAIRRLPAPSTATLLAILAASCGGGMMKPAAPVATGYPTRGAPADWSGAPGAAPSRGSTWNGGGSTWNGGAPATPPPSPPPASISASAGTWGPSGGGDSIALPTPEPAPRPDERPGLGTSWGEDTYSPITSVPFTRASDDPWAEVTLRYNDETGVAAQAAYYGGAMAPLEARAGDGSIGISLVDDDGRTLPGVWAGGQPLVAGTDGERYRIVVRNGSRARFEIVASVDGLDVIDGKPASPDRRGYLVDPGGQLVIDGFRQSDDEVAAFRFGRVASSYAAQTAGDSNVGVIGLAVFAERGAVWTPTELRRRDAADPFPARSYATAPR